MRHLLTLWDSRGGPGGERGLSRGGSLGFEQSGGVAGAAQPPWEGTAGRVTNKATGPHALGPGGARGRGAGTWSRGWVALGEDPGRSGVRAGVQALSAPWLGGSPRISTGLFPPAPHVRKVPRRDQVEASGRRNTRSYWAPWGGPQDADPAEGRPGAQAPGEAVARSPACGHRTVQTPFCRRLHKWGELEPSRGKCLSS